MEMREDGDYIYLSLHCHHQNVSCSKMGSDESHFNSSLIERDKVTRLCPQTTTFLKREESPKWNQTEALSAYQPNDIPLQQTGSHATHFFECRFTTTETIKLISDGELRAATSNISHT